MCVCVFVDGAEMGVTALRNLLSSVLRIGLSFSVVFLSLTPPSAVLVDEHEELFQRMLFSLFFPSFFLRANTTASA